MRRVALSSNLGRAVGCVYRAYIPMRLGFCGARIIATRVGSGTSSFKSQAFSGERSSATVNPVMLPPDAPGGNESARGRISAERDHDRDGCCFFLYCRCYRAEY